MRATEHKVRFTCEHCGRQELVTTFEIFPDLPEGWGRYTSSGWGLTDYTKTEELCPTCLAAVQ
jgi:hypothetical protein